MTYPYGRRPPKNAPALALGPLLTGVVPEHPVSLDHLDAQGWDMLGNDTYGDCVAVTWANFRRLMTRQAGHENYPSQQQVFTLYKTQNPGFPAEDNGMDIQTCLEHLVTVGGPDGVRAVAFAKVDHTNPEEVKAAIALFGGVWTGLNVQQANMTQFDNLQPWNYVPGSPVDGGHSVLTGGYGNYTGGMDELFITWAEECGFTDSFWAHQVEEAWVVVWPEHFTSAPFLAGVSVIALALDYQELTGKALPVPAPLPGPTPTPAPAPVPTPVPAPNADGILAGAAHVWLATKHYGKSRVLANQLAQWLAAKGL